MSIERIGVGPRMSGAVVHGDTIYLCGQTAEEADGAGAQTGPAFGLAWGCVPLATVLPVPPLRRRGSGRAQIFSDQPLGGILSIRC